MIQKSLTIVVVLLALYGAFRMAKRTDDPVAQNIEQQTSTKILGSLHHDVAKDHVIVGSSIASKIDEDVAAGRFYNLASREHGVFGGLAMINASGTLPKTILIETNALEDEARTTVAKNIERLRWHIVYFEKQGVNIVFFEMPVHPNLVASQQFQHARNEIRKALQPDKYDYVPDVDPTNYTTSDGRHLDLDSAARYTSYLLEEFAKLSSL